MTDSQDLTRITACAVIGVRSTGIDDGASGKSIGPKRRGGDTAHLSHIRELYLFDGITVVLSVYERCVLHIRVLACGIDYG